MSPLWGGQQSITTTSSASPTMCTPWEGGRVGVEGSSKPVVKPVSALAWLDKRVNEMRVAL